VDGLLDSAGLGDVLAPAMDMADDVLTGLDDMATGLLDDTGLGDMLGSDIMNTVEETNIVGMTDTAPEADAVGSVTETASDALGGLLETLDADTSSGSLLGGLLDTVVNTVEASARAADGMTDAVVDGYIDDLAGGGVTSLLAMGDGSSTALSDGALWPEASGGNGSLAEAFGDSGDEGSGLSAPEGTIAEGLGLLDTPHAGGGHHGLLGGIFG